MKTVKQLLDTKGHQVYSISPEASVFDAIKLMAEKEVGALLVMQAGELVGMISERDYARKVILQERSSRLTAIGEIMTTDVIYTHPTQRIDECMALMTEKRIRHLPVMHGKSVQGVI
jgi:CBS domain-containing protein